MYCHCVPGAAPLRHLLLPHVSRLALRLCVHGYQVKVLHQVVGACRCCSIRYMMQQTSCTHTGTPGLVEVGSAFARSRDVRMTLGSWGLGFTSDTLMGAPCCVCA